MKHVLTLLLLYGTFAVLAWRQVPDWPYGYDESDYMFAASLGLKANFTDTPTMPIGEFVRTGLSRARPSDLSSSIRSANDIVFYRHWHGPLYFYWLLGNTSFRENPQLMRALQLIFPILGGLVIYLGSLQILSWPAATLSTALYLWSEAVLRSPDLAPHQLFALCSLAGLFLLARMMITGSRRHWYGAIVFAALAFCTLEVAFVLVITILICGHLEQKRLKADLRFAAKSAGVFVGVVLIVWPGALLKLSFFKAYAFMAYLALFRTAAWGTNMTVWQVWGVRFANSPAEWVVIAAGIVAYAFARRELRRVLLPFALFAAMMIVTVFRVNAVEPRYMLPFLPALHVLAGSSLADRSLWSRLGHGWRPVAAMALICIALFGARWYFLTTHPLGNGAGGKALLTWVRDRHLGDKRLLIPQGVLPMLHYYFPHAQLTSYHDAQSFEAARAQGGYAGILYPGEVPQP